MFKINAQKKLKTNNLLQFLISLSKEITILSAKNTVKRVEYYKFELLESSSFIHYDD